MKMNKNTQKSKGVGRTRIMNVQFYNIAPRAINCMACSKFHHKLALARNDGSIEIWDMEHTPYLQKIAPKLTNDGDFSVETIAWSGKRLFSAGLTGELIEWDTTIMVPKRQQQITGNSIWCLSVNRQGTELAIGTEEGYINVYDIQKDEFQYKMLYDKQEGRVICCCYDSTGDYLVTGSVKSIRVWNARTGQAMQKMSLPKSPDNTLDTIVWTLQVLDNFSIISGDSRGCVNVYDGHTGEHLEAHQVLKTDILALQVNEAQDMLVCSGVEPAIRIYAKTQIKREDKTFYRWVKYLQRSVHDHDVKALCVLDNRIISGGVDGYLGVSYVTRMLSTISRHGPFLQPPCATVSDAAKLVLLRYPTYLEIWRLGTAKINSDNKPDKKSENLDRHSKTCTLEEFPKKLLEFRSKYDAHIVCSTVSPNGKLICYSTGKETRLFNLINSEEGDKMAISRLERNKNTLLESTPATHMAFSNDSQSLFLVTRLTRNLLIMTQEHENDFTLKETIELSKHLKGFITHLTLSATAKRVAMADDEQTIAVWHSEKPNTKFVHLLNLPRYGVASITSIALHANIQRIVAVYTDNRIVEYDLEKARYTMWEDQSYIVPNTGTHCAIQTVLDERNTDIIVLQNDGFLYALEKYLPENDVKIDVSSKKPKISKQKENQTLSTRLKFQKSYEHLVHTSWLNSEELVTISVNPNALIEQLPAAYAQKKFGTA